MKKARKVSRQGRSDPAFRRGANVQGFEWRSRFGILLSRHVVVCRKGKVQVAARRLHRRFKSHGGAARR